MAATSRLWYKLYANTEFYQRAFPSFFPLTEMNFLNCSGEHVENIGIHYYQTLRCWRKNFLERQKYVINLIETHFCMLNSNNYLQQLIIECLFLC